MSSLGVDKVEPKNNFPADGRPVSMKVTPPKKKRRVWLWLLMIFVVFPLLIGIPLGLLSGVGGGSSTKINSASEAEKYA